MRRRASYNFPWLPTLLWGLSCLLAAAPDARAADAHAGEPTREYRIKAAFVFKFTQFTEWPPRVFGDDRSPLIVAVVGENPFNGALEAAVANKRVQGRTLAFRHFPHADALAAAAAEAGVGGGPPSPCHVLFVSASEAQRVPEIARVAQQFGILTVSDVQGFNADGGMIRLFQEKENIAFEIRRNAADGAGLKLDSRLLKLARLYRD